VLLSYLLVAQNPSSDKPPLPFGPSAPDIPRHHHSGLDFGGVQIDNFCEIAQIRACAPIFYGKLPSRMCGWLGALGRGFCRQENVIKPFGRRRRYGWVFMIGF